MNQEASFLAISYDGYFQITMNDVLLMQVSNSLECLHEELECFWFWEAIFAILVAEEIAMIGIFHDHKDPITIDEGIPQFDDMRMI